MRGMQAALTILVLVGFPIFAANADVEFGEDDFGGDGSETGEIVVPQDQQLREKEYNEFYEAAVGRDRAKPIENPGANEFMATEEEPGYNMDGYPFSALPESVDGDRDGLADSDEGQIGTEASLPDTDGDGFADGVEVVRGYNPLVAAPGDKVVYTMAEGLATDSAYSISGVRMGGSESQRLLVVTGVAPANGIVMLFVQSDETLMWAARADGTGRFLYSSAAIPEQGSHQIYATRPSADGVLASASQPIKFEIGGDGLNVVQNPFLEAAGGQAAEEEGSGQKIIFLTLGLAVTGMVIAFIIIFLVLMWVMRRTRRKLAQRVRESWPLGRHK